MPLTPAHEGFAHECANPASGFPASELKEYQMKIAVVGAGNVGATLGRGWAHRQHEVTFAVRNPADPKHAPLAGPRIQVAAVPDAVAASEGVVLATPWPLTH